MFFVLFLCHTCTNTFRAQQKYRDPGSISSSYCGPFVCPTIPNINSKVGRNDNHHIVAFRNFRWLFLCSFFLVVGLLDRARIYAAPIRVLWRVIPCEHVFRSSTTNTLSVLYYANALWLMLRLIQPGVVYTGTRTTDNPY